MKRFQTNFVANLSIYLWLNSRCIQLVSYKRNMSKCDASCIKDVSSITAFIVTTFGSYQTRAFTCFTDLKQRNRYILNLKCMSLFLSLSLQTDTIQCIVILILYHGKNILSTRSYTNSLLHLSRFEDYMNTHRFLKSKQRSVHSMSWDVFSKF